MSDRCVPAAVSRFTDSCEQQKTGEAVGQIAADQSEQRMWLSCSCESVGVIRASCSRNWKWDAAGQRVKTWASDGKLQRMKSTLLLVLPSLTRFLSNGTWRRLKAAMWTLLFIYLFSSRVTSCVALCFFCFHHKYTRLLSQLSAYFAPRGASWNTSLSCQFVRYASTLSCPPRPALSGLTSDAVPAWKQLKSPEGIWKENRL